MIDGKNDLQKDQKNAALMQRFDVAMKEKNYHTPMHSLFDNCFYLNQRDEDRFEGFRLAVGVLDKEFANLRNWAQTAWERGYKMGDAENNRQFKLAIAALAEVRETHAFENEMISNAMSLSDADNARLSAEVERLRGMVDEIQAARHIKRNHDRLVKDLAGSLAKNTELQDEIRRLNRQIEGRPMPHFQD